MISWLVFFLYRYLLLPTALFILKISHPFLPAKIKEMWTDRQNLNWPELPARPIWIHASSGEIEYAKSVIRAIKEKWPQRMILVTYFSPSAKKLIKSITGVDAVIPLPWDHRFLVKKFLTHFRPEFFLISRTDAWPEFAYQTHKLKIPSILFSATFATESRRQGFFSTPLTRFTFNHLTQIDCVSEEDIQEIAKIKSHTSTSVTGDTRYDQVLWRVLNPLDHRQELKPSTSPIWVIGSSWPQDEKVLFPAFLGFIQSGGKIILAPHEVDSERIQKICLQLSSLGLSWTLYSKAKEWLSENILIIDQVGRLQEIYTWGDFAFVGGSFKDKVHSVMEPLAAGLPVLVGPFHANNREALHFQNIQIQGVSVVTSVGNSEDLIQTLKVFEKQIHHWPNLRKNLRLKLQEKAGATKKLLGQIESLSP